MEDYLDFWKMEEDLDFWKMRDELNFLFKSKVTPILKLQEDLVVLKMEDDLNFLKCLKRINIYIIISPAKSQNTIVTDLFSEKCGSCECRAMVKSKRRTDIIDIYTTQ